MGSRETLVVSTGRTYFRRKSGVRLLAKNVREQLSDYYP
jgi:hypothetical protein